MFAGLLLLLDLGTASPAAVCLPSAIVTQVQAAQKLMASKDTAGATATIDAAARCPATSYPAFVAHVVRADLAVAQGDWTAARVALDGLEVHSEAKLSARAGFLRLRTDEGLGDVAAFARDRAALIAANDAALQALGRRLETFRAGAATVTVYEAMVDQGPFRRTAEFIIVPDDPAAYPASILITDDRQAAVIGKQLAKPGEAKPEHAWFLDLYTCGQHATLRPPIMKDAATPDTVATKAQIVTLLATPLTGTTSAERAVCFASGWILPGLGAAR